MIVAYGTHQIFQKAGTSPRMDEQTKVDNAWLLVRSDIGNKRQLKYSGPGERTAAWRRRGLHVRDLVAQLSHPSRRLNSLERARRPCRANIRRADGDHKSPEIAKQRIGVLECQAVVVDPWNSFITGKTNPYTRDFPIIHTAHISFHLLASALKGPPSRPNLAGFSVFASGRHSHSRTASGTSSLIWLMQINAC